MSRRRAAVLALAATCAAAGSAQAKKFATFTEEGLPNVQSASAIVVDLDDGEVLYEKNADEVRPIASTGKIFAAMAARREDLDLAKTTEILAIDRRYAEGGARSRLRVGRSFRNLDLLRAMLIASDNRAPTALGRAVGMSPDRFVATMNRVARKLGLEHTEFVGPVGLNENVSTAREMASAFRTALEDPVLADIMGTPIARVRSRDDRPRVIQYRHTNRPLHGSRYEVLAGKTGYTDAADYCLLIAAEIAGRRVVMAFFGAQGKLTRFGDYGRVGRWLTRVRGADDTQVASSGAEVRGLVPVAATP